MVKKAILRVFLCSQATLPKESASENKYTVRSGTSSEGAEYPKVYHRRVKPGAAAHEPEETPIHEPEVEAGKKRSSREEELVKHPNLTIVGPMFPHFSRMLSGISLPHGRDIYLVR